MYADVQASEMMQNTMEDDDLEFFWDVDFDPPYDVDRDYIACGRLRAYVKLIIEKIDLEKKLKNAEDVKEKALDKVVSDEEEAEEDEENADVPQKEDDEEDKDDVEEASVTANVAGYTLPLGASNKRVGESPSWTHYARSFGRAKRVGRR